MPAPVSPADRFGAIVASIARATPRDELVISEIPAPTGLAPFAHALAADVNPAHHADDSDLGTGRLIVLFDPDEPEAWEGAIRIICFAQAPLEHDIGVDPFVADVAWSWLMDGLAVRDAQFTAESGTATKVLSTGFGSLAPQGSGAQLELRASWSPIGDELTAHVEGWTELLCMLAGYPPTQEGVTPITALRGPRA